MALRAAGATIVGSTTSGADGDTSEIFLPGGYRTYISGIGVFYPDRRPTQQVGIVPDIFVVRTPAGIAAGRDEVIEEAIALVKTAGGGQ
jgi:C-terminal processing protease CtpA/Prc